MPKCAQLIFVATHAGDLVYCIYLFSMTFFDCICDEFKLICVRQNNDSYSFSLHYPL